MENNEREIIMDFLVGQPFEHSKKYLAANGFDWRLVSEDGEHYMLTQDYCPDRINIAVESGTITKVSFG